MAQSSKDIVVNLKLKDDGSSTLVIKNLSEQIKSVGKAFNTIERDVDKTSTRITELNTTLRDARKSIADLVAKSGSTSSHLKEFNKQMMSLRELARMMGESLRLSRTSVEKLGVSTTTTANQVKTAEATMTAAVAKGTAARTALRVKESFGTTQAIPKTAGTYIRPSSSKLSSFSDNAIISMREELKKTVPIWDTVAENTKKSTIANANWAKGVQAMTANYVEWSSKATTGTTAVTKAQKGFWGSLKDTANGLASVNMHKEGAIAKTAFLVTKVLKLMAAYMAFRFALQMVSQEMKAAFTVTEDYTRSVVEMAALMTTFAVPKPGEDPSETYQRSYEYAKKLVIELEKLDMQTIANAQDLKTMAQAFIMNGVQINVQNKQAMEGFRNLANALKILVGNFPNQQAQISQEIRAMLLGTAKASDTLSKIMKAKLGSGWADIMKKWRAEGPDTFLIKIGDLLKGFGSATKDIEGMWETLTSSLKTIHDIIFRMAFKGLHQDIIGGLQGVVSALRDAEGNLTPLARNIGKALVESWLFFKEIVKDVYIFLTPILWAIKTIVKFLWEIKALAPIIIGLFSIWLLKVMGIAAVLRLMTGTSAVAFAALTASIGAATTATGRLVAMLNVLKANWILLAIGAITSAFFIMKNAIDKTARSISELRQEYKFLTMDELKREEGKQRKILGERGIPIVTTDKDWVSSMPKTYDEISKKFDELSRKELLSSQKKYTDQLEYLQAKKEEHEISTQITALAVKMKEPKHKITAEENETIANLEKQLNLRTQIAEKVSKQTDIKLPKRNLDNLPGLMGATIQGGFILYDEKAIEAANKFKAIQEEITENYRTQKEVKAPELSKTLDEGNKDALKAQLDVWKNELENIKSTYKDRQQAILDASTAEEAALKSRLDVGEILESEATKISIALIEEKKNKLLTSLKEETMAVENAYKKMSEYAIAKKIPEAERKKIKSDADKDLEDRKRREAKTMSEAETDIANKKIADFLRINKLKIQQIAIDKQYAENRIQYANQVGQVEEEFEKKRVEFMKEISEMGAGGYYEKQFAFIEQTKNRELKTLEEMNNSWNDYFIKKSKDAIPTEEVIKDLYNENTEHFAKSEEDKLKITTTANNARLEMLRTMGRDIEKIYGEQGDAGVMLRALDDLDKEWKKKWDDIYKFTQDTFKGITDSGSNLMFDALTGKLDSFGNYFKDVWNKILKYITDETSKTFVKMFEDIIKPQLEKLVSSPFNSYASQVAFPVGGALASGNLELPNQLETFAPELIDGLESCGEAVQDSTKMLDKNTKGLDNTTKAMTLVAAAIAVFQMASQALSNPGSVRAGSFAMSGAAIGALIGSLGGPLAAIIGAGIGLVAGFITGGLIDLFNKVEKIAMKFKFDVSNLSVDVSEGTFGLSDKMSKALGRTFLAFRESLISLATNMGSSVEKFYRDWEGTQNSGDADKALGRIMRKYLMFTLNIDPKDFKRQGEDLQETIDRIIGALKGLTRLNVTLGITIEQIGKVSDEMLDWNIKMAGLKDDIKEYTTAFANMFDQAVDPSDMNAMAQNLYNALVEKYNMEKQMVQDLVDKIKTARENFVSFISDLSKKIYDMGAGENIGRYKSGTGLENSPEYLTYLKKTMDDLKQTVIDMSNATDTFTPEQIVTGFEDMKKAIDDWYETMTTAITDYYERQIAVIQEGIDLLNEEKDANDKKLDILNKQVDAIKDWKSLLDDVNTMIWDMKTSISSPRDSRERLAYALGGVLEARSKFLGAGTEEEKLAAGKTYQERLSDYLKIAQEAYTRPSSEYQAIYNQIITWLGEIAGYAEDNSKDPTELLKEIADLEARNEIIQNQIDAKTAEIASLNKLMQEDLAALKVDAKEYYQWVKDNGTPAYETYINSLEQQLKDIIGTGTVQEYFIDLRDALVIALQEIRDKLGIYFGGLTNPEMTDKQAKTELKRLQNMEKLATKISVLENKPSTPANLSKLEELREDLEKLKSASPSQTGASYFVPMIALIEKQLDKLKEGSDKYLSLKNILDILKTGVIPEFGSGAFVKKPTLALIAERGPEYVTSQKHMQEMTGRLKKFESEESNVIFSPHFVINTTGTVDEKHLANVIQDRIFTSLRKGKGRKILNKVY